jgi:hypothetical protein
MVLLPRKPPKNFAKTILEEKKREWKKRQEMCKKKKSALPRKTKQCGSTAREVDWSRAKPYLDRRKDTRDDETGGDEVLTLRVGEATVKGTADKQRHSDDACKHKVTHGPSVNRNDRFWDEKHLLIPERESWASARKGEIWERGKRVEERADGRRKPETAAMHQPRAQAPHMPCHFSKRVIENQQACYLMEPSSKTRRKWKCI